MSKNLALVCTTIGDGKFLDGYCLAAAHSLELREVGRIDIIVIGDRKTPDSLYKACRDCRKSFGASVKCPGLDEQDLFLKRLGLQEIVPYNSDNRRNIGYLLALEAGADVVISIDDDNFCIPGSGFFEDHRQVGEPADLPTRESSNGWYNVCNDLSLFSVFPRGFPYNARRTFGEISFLGLDKLKVAVNQGLWVGDPDVDAITWVCNPKLKVGWRNVDPFMVGPGTWLPINSQNTAVSREAMIAYYFIPMEGTVDGWKMGRMGDIFQGYFLEACVKQMNQGIRIGTPLVHHLRNSHKHMDDLVAEVCALPILERLLPWLREQKLAQTSYSDAYESLIQALEEVAGWPSMNFPEDVRGYLKRTTLCMRKWVEACKMVGFQNF